MGTAGHDLQTNIEGGLSLNQLDPQYMALGSALNQTVPNPFFGIVNSGMLVSPTISRAQSLRPYPQFPDVIPLQNTGATSIYHALQMSVNRRMSGGLAARRILRVVEGGRRRGGAPEQLRRRRQPIGRLL